MGMLTGGPLQTECGAEGGQGGPAGLVRVVSRAEEHGDVDSFLATSLICGWMILGQKRWRRSSLV